MGLAKQQLEENKFRKAKKPAKGVPGMFYTWRPAETDLDGLGAFLKDDSEALKELSSVLARGLSVKVAFREESASFFATAVEITEYPDPAKGLSVWHSDPVKCLLAVLYALTEVYPEFPECDWPPYVQASLW